LSAIPAGGLYRLETRHQPGNQPAGEWAERGDMRHFLGVGDLWVIAGQSNSAGYGRGPVFDPPELGIHLFRNNGQWALATHPLNESTDTLHPVNRDGANTAHAPYILRGTEQALGCQWVDQTSRVARHWPSGTRDPPTGRSPQPVAAASGQVQASGARGIGVRALTGHTYLRLAQTVAAWRQS
jgi:hypothetical protein